MYGRGYVNNGRKLAEAYILKEWKQDGLQAPPKPREKANRAGYHKYLQNYAFPIVTFPGRLSLTINGKPLKPGADYLIDASSAAWPAGDMRATTVDFGAVKDMAAFKKVYNRFSTRGSWLLKNLDTLCKALNIRQEEIASALPEGCYLVPQANKLTWTAEGTQNQATVFYVKQDALPPDVTEINAEVETKFMAHSKNGNIIAIAPGEVRDTFIAFTGHYDHLGMMGDSAIFPGASDNASGISLLLWLAAWFWSHPQHYSVLFIAFSGEEAGLLGSEYYVAHPVVPLANIKFLTNIDIMGDATDGVTVVNATEFPKQFGLLQHINDSMHCMPVIKSRGKAHNSDHWHFTEAGVPSFFIYSNGGKGYYHDIYDKPEELSLNHVAGVAELLVEFVKELPYAGSVK